MDPNNTPANVPPPGVKPDLHAPNPEVPFQIGLSIVCMLICVLPVAVRIYTRRVILEEFKLDDSDLWKAGSVTFASVEIVSCGLGKGKHGWDVSIADYRHIYVLVNIEAIIYCLVLFCAKYAVLELIRSIFYDHRRQKTADRVIWGLIWANLLLYSLVVLLIIFGCKPVKKQWKPEVPGHCLNQIDLYIPSSLLNILSDFTVLAVPLAAISKLQAPVRTKIAAGSLFSIGVFACMASIARFYYTFKLDPLDASWFLLTINQWALGEITTVMLVACLPFVPRFYTHIKSKMSPSSQAPGNSPTYVPDYRDRFIARRRSRPTALTVDTGSNMTEEISRAISDSSKGSQSQGDTQFDTVVMV